MTYEGWSNYPTWCVNLWLSNDEGLYFSTLEMQKHYQGSQEDEPETEDDVFGFADAIKDLIEEFKPEVKGLYSDLLQWSISQANYEEIAKSWLE